VSGTRKQSSPSQILLIGAYAAVYLSWGSTFLAIRYAIETLPPFLVAAAIIVLAVVFMTTDRRRPIGQPEGEAAVVTGD
jgi:drug/metabolite transporter (DMT)-like permease